jgi:hypothetical protein
MPRLSVLVLAMALSARALAGEPDAQVIDLRAPQALEELRRKNPAHFDKVRRMLAGLEEEPSRVEGDWLQVTFDARDIDLSRLLIKTSNPPKQLLRFSLDEVRYTMYVTRSDLVAIVLK